MSRNDASKMSGVLCIIAVTYCAWKITTYRENIERYFAQQVYQNVTALITLYSDGHTVNTLEDKKKRRQQVRRRTGSSRKGHRPIPYCQVPGARFMKRKGARNLPRMMCLAAVAMKASNRRQAKVSLFDSDAKMIRVDNCASYCISNDVGDFITDLRPIKRKLKGLGGMITDIQTGTIRWKIQDDQGEIHVIDIPGSLYVKDSPSRLLSPQHWAQSAKDNFPKQNGTWCATYHDRVVLHWKQRSSQRTISLNPESSNVAALYTAPGYSKFEAFCAECEGRGGEKADMAGYDATNWASDEEGPESGRELRVLSQRERQKSERADLRYVRDLWKGGTTPTSFDLNSEGTEEVPTLVETEDEVTTKETPTSELLRIHHALGHLSMKKLQTMAKQGIIPRRLAKCQVPLCSSCLYGKATRRPWRTKPTKGDKISKLRTATSPGQCVSVDQLESLAPGLIAQM